MKFFKCGTFRYASPKLTVWRDLEHLVAFTGYDWGRSTLKTIDPEYPALLDPDEMTTKLQEMCREGLPLLLVQ